MAALQCSTHEFNIADAFKGIVHATLSHVYDDILYWSFVVLGVDKVGCTKVFGNLKFIWVNVDSDDPLCVSHLRTDHRR
ncbi:hypothetical protein D3C85_1107380 [compost metagenome]